MNAPPNYYEEAMKIIDALKANDHIDDAEKLSDAIEYGSTSTEILMKLRYHLINIMKNNNIPSVIKVDARTLSEKINNILT
ncbi:MAG: hypothetical protein F8N37_19335 [Telmatospirillum sp.]|nr:hypothetical protein [Telmatospirillum sp.]